MGDIECLMECILLVVQGKRQCPELLGDVTIRELSADEAWDVVMDSSKMEVKYRNRLIRK